MKTSFRWRAASAEDAARLAPSIVSDDKFLPAEDRRDRVEALYVAKEEAEIDVKQKYVEDAQLREPISTGSIAYYLGDCEVRVMGKGRGKGMLSVAFYDEDGHLSCTDVPSAMCKPVASKVEDFFTAAVEPISAEEAIPIEEAKA